MEPIKDNDKNNTENKFVIKRVLVQFSKAGKLFSCNSGNLDLMRNDSVVCETERGLNIGTIVSKPEEITLNKGEKLPNVIRLASENDHRQLERNIEKEKNAFDICLKKIIEMNLPMKLIRVQFTLGGGKAAFYFSSEGRVDFRELVKILAQELHTKIEMIQIGVRDEAKMTGGMGICGKEFCCASFLRSFAPVSIKMAKVQNLALNPQKVSGGCGRLLCCLAYEFSTYQRLGKDFPKLGKRVETKRGFGKVKFVDIFRGKLQIEFEDGQEETIDADELINPSRNQEDAN